LEGAVILPVFQGAIILKISSVVKLKEPNLNSGTGFLRLLPAFWFILDKAAGYYLSIDS
jgi:hypothetical protein